MTENGRAQVNIEISPQDYQAIAEEQAAEAVRLRAALNAAVRQIGQLQARLPKEGSDASKEEVSRGTRGGDASR